MTRVLHLYGRRDCHLCADMRDALDGFELVEFDVDEDPELLRRFGARVPVLTGPDGTEICHYFFDAGAMRRYLDAR